jgi:peptide/nickel transport system permease protein
MQGNPMEVAPWGDRLTKNRSGSPNRMAAVLQGVWQFCRRKPLGALGGFIVLGLLIMAVFAPWIAPYQYDETIPGARMKAPGAQFWMGTDNLGRDVYSRVVYGAAVSVTVGFGAVLLANLLATVIGITSGYFGGAYDICVQRVVDAWQSFPFLVVILSLMAVLGPGLLNLVLALGVLGAAAGSRVIRGTTISVMQNTYVEAARALGAGHLRIMLRYVLPNVATTRAR